MQVVTGQFSDSYLPVMDGVSLTIRNYLFELNRSLGPSYAVVPGIPGHPECRTPETLRYFSVPLIGRPPYRIGLPQADPFLHRMLRDRTFDLVHAHSPFFAGRYALKLARCRGIPIVSTFHSKYREKIQNAMPPSSLADRVVVDPLVRRIVDFYTSVDQVWVPTEAAVETLREYGYQGEVEIVRHGIDFHAPDDRGELRRGGEAFLGLKRRDFLFLYVGDHAWEKNLAFLLQSLEMLNAGGCEFKMVFVGEGYAAKALRLMSARAGLDGKTTFTGVLRDRDLLSACYARADCFLFPSLYDTCGLVVREAAAFGVPSVVIASSAAAEPIEDGYNGFVTDNSVQAFAHKLKFLLAHPDLLRRAGEGAANTLSTSWREVVAEVKERYLNLLRRPCSQPCSTVAAPGKYLVEEEKKQ